MLGVSSSRSHFKRQIFKMKMFIFLVLLLSGGGMGDGLEKVFKLAEFIADIYQQLERGCLYLMNSQARNQGEIEFYIISCHRYNFSKQQTRK
jgi:hypothetical protein